VLSQAAARWLLVLHAVLGAATVAAATHWALWLRSLVRGRHGRLRATRRFGVIAVTLFGLNLACGLVLYPTYKVRVKLEYLTSPPAVADDAEARLQAAERLVARREGREPRPLDPVALQQRRDDAALHADKAARWFDVKEHWVAVGLALGLATLAVLLVWNPKRDGPGPARFVLLGTVGVAGIAWLAAIIGVLTAATRSF